LDRPDVEGRGRDDDINRLISAPRQFGLNADTECFRCSAVRKGKSAELLYMSALWDYYYCYSCRGWFKRPFRERRMVIPVDDERIVRQLTEMHMWQMESLHQNRVIFESVRRFLRGFERRISHA
jgi:hypothetical protein